jgi:enamine deaminase RidA (YjgF/YER057c/UK114 family)
MTFARMLLLAGLSMGFSAHAARAEVVRHPIPNSTFPIAQAVEVSGNVRTIYVSGQVPPVVNKDADPNSREAYGDTRTQTVGALNRIKAILEGLGLTMADVVKM